MRLCAPLTRDERTRIRSQIWCCLANLGEFRLFWVPGFRRIVARSVAVRRHFRVPDGAHLVGHYAEGTTMAVIFADLEDVLAGLPGDAPPACDAGDGCAQTAVPKATPAPKPSRALGRS